MAWTPAQAAALVELTEPAPPPPAPGPPLLAGARGPWAGLGPIRPMLAMPASVTAPPRPPPVMRCDLRFKLRRVGGMGGLDGLGPLGL